MKRRILALVLGVFSMATQASLIDRGDGFIYDDVLDITWTQNANINGQVWQPNQVDWAAGYSQTHTVYGTFDDWRLADMDLDGDGTVIDCSTASEVDCRDNEYGYMYYRNGVTSSSPSPFTNVQSGAYWSGTDGPSIFMDAWFFTLSDGYQDWDLEDHNLYAWAVRAGDVAPVPVPAAVWLFGSGLVGLVGMARRKKA